MFNVVELKFNAAEHKFNDVEHTFSDAKLSFHCDAKLSLHARRFIDNLFFCYLPFTYGSFLAVIVDSYFYHSFAVS